MGLDKVTLGGITILGWLIYSYVLYPFYLSPFAKIPGPKLAAMTSAWITWVDFGGKRSETIDKLHRKHGKVVRVGPNELSFTGMEAMQKIYGAGTTFSKAAYFYNIFMAYGCRPLFAILDNATHASRKKLFSQIHSKSFMMSPPMETNMKEKISRWVNSFGSKTVKDVRTDVRYITIDVISRHLWGEAAEYSTLDSDDEKQRIDEVINLKNVYLPAWLIHFPRFSWWMEKRIRLYLGVNPMHTVREHAQTAYRKFKVAGGKSDSTTTVGGKLFTQHVSNGGYMTDDQIAAELGDLFLAGLDTTADTMTCMFWTLSKPEYAQIQEKLRKEVQELRFTDGLPSVADADKLPYLDAILKETLRVFPINAGSQPRIASAGKPVEIYGLEIPPGTICEMQAYSLNRAADVFENPDAFDPERWMIPRDSLKYKEMNRQIWSFSSGPRMCIGQQFRPPLSKANGSFAMAEMQLITATVYNRYSSTISPLTTDKDMELDDQVTLSGPMSRNCWIDFEILK